MRGNGLSNETSNECQRYPVVSETPFKEIFKNHARDFKDKKYEKWTELSKYIWTLKSQGITPMVKWSIVKKVNNKTVVNYYKLFLDRNVLHHSIPQW